MAEAKFIIDSNYFSGEMESSLARLDKARVLIKLRQEEMMARRNDSAVRESEHKKKKKHKDDR